MGRMLKREDFGLKAGEFGDSALDRPPEDEIGNAEVWHPMAKMEPLAETELNRLGGALARVIAWATKSSALEDVGMRTLVVAYVLNPDSISMNSEAKLARSCKVERATVSKLVCELKAYFGVQTRASRTEENQDKCRRAQTQLS